METAAVAIRFEQRHTYRDYVELNAASFKLQAARVLLLALVIFMLTVPLYVQPGAGTARKIWVIMPWAVIFGLLGLFLIRVSAWSPWRQSAERLGPVRVELSRDGLSLKAPQAAMTRPWSDFTHVTETANLLLIWNAEERVSLLKPAMREAQVLDQVQALIHPVGLRRRRWLP